MDSRPRIVIVHLRVPQICSALLAPACWVLLLFNTADTKSDQRKLAQTIVKVRTGDPLTAREAAEHLSQMTRRMNPKSVPDQTVTDLISLLDIPDDLVRYWVARSLGNLGPLARAAIPQLHKLLAEVDCVQGSKTSASGIRFALTQMGVPPPPPACEPSSKPN